MIRCAAIFVIAQFTETDKSKATQRRKQTKQNKTKQKESNAAKAKQ